MKPKTIADVVRGYDAPLARLVEDYFRGNEAARVALDLASRADRPFVIDHAAIRTHRVDERAREFEGIGFEFRDELVEFSDQGWWAKVYRKRGMPALFVDQAYDDERGKKSLLSAWVDRFGDRVLHHVAIRVADIDAAKAELERVGVQFSGAVVGPRGTRLRQIFTAAEVRDGHPFTVLELAERNGYEGFVPEQADGLMQSSVVKKTA